MKCDDIRIYSEHRYLYPVRMAHIQNISSQLDALARRLPKFDIINVPDIFK